MSDYTCCLNICSTQSGNLHILRIPKLRANLEIAHWVYAISRSRSTSAQSRDSTISVACTIEPFEFPSYIKVRDVSNKLLQLRRHFQCLANVLRNLEIAQTYCVISRLSAQSRDWCAISGFWECTAQSWDCANS